MRSKKPHMYESRRESEVSAAAAFQCNGASLFVEVHCYFLYDQSATLPAQRYYIDIRILTMYTVFSTYQSNQVLNITPYLIGPINLTPDLISPVMTGFRRLNLYVRHIHEFRGVPHTGFVRVNVVAVYETLQEYGNTFDECELLAPMWAIGMHWYRCELYV